LSGELEEILSQKAEEIRTLRGRVLAPGPAPRPPALGRRPGGPLSLIAEIKRRSPSAGALSVELGVGERARVYERSGASMISVLVDTRFFDGAWQHLAEARAASTLPLLCKEFVLDEVQLDAARAFGADAVLLIVRILEPARLEILVREARARQLTPLVEVVDEDEARLALDAGATLVGVNARDLDTLEIDAARAARTLAALPEAVTSVHLSGLATPASVLEVARGPAHAALVGEALMREDDPESLLRSLVGAASGAG
jgi:indole-3-glycerol phosphate synthase